MSLFAAIAAFLLTSALSLGLSAALSEGFVPGGQPHQPDVAPVPPLDPVPPHDQNSPQAVDERQASITIDGQARAAVLRTPTPDTPDNPNPAPTDAPTDTPDPATTPVPGVVLVAGSGSADEDSLSSEARAFAQQGVAVLTYDKDERGYTPFTRDYAGLADDAAAAAQWLSAQPGVDSARVGLMGFSEGGWVAPMAADKHDGIAFVGMVSSPVVTPLENAAYASDQAIAGWPTPLRALSATVMSGGRWLCNYLEIDLRSQIDPLSIPVLAVFGADDASVPLGEATTRLQKIAPAASVEILPATGHHVPVTTGRWVARASAWMHDPNTFPPGVAGAPPAQEVGLLRLPDKAWFQHPGLHLAISVTAAIVVGFSARRTLIRRSTRT